MNISCPNKTVTYNGSVQIIDQGSITGLPVGAVVSVEYYKDGQAVNDAITAGEYDVKVSVMATGYYSTSITTKLIINKATYNMSGITFTNKTVTENGDSHSITINGTLPAGVSVSYINNGQTQPGTYTITANFHGDSTNYNPIPSKQAILTITEIVGENPDSGDDNNEFITSASSVMRKSSYFDQTFVPTITMATSDNYADPIYNNINKDRGFLDGLFRPTILNGFMFEYETSEDGSAITISISASNYNAEEIYNILINDNDLYFNLYADEDHYGIEVIDNTTLEICCLESQKTSFVNNVLYILSKILVYKEGDVLADRESVQNIHNELLYRDNLEDFTSADITCVNSSGTINIIPYNMSDIESIINLIINNSFYPDILMKPVNILEVNPSFIYEEQFTRNIPNLNSNVLFLEFFRGGNNMPALYRRMFALIFKYVCNTFGLPLVESNLIHDYDDFTISNEIENIIIAEGETIDINDIDFAIFENQAYMLEYDNLFSQIFQTVRNVLISLQEQGYFADVCSDSFENMMGGNSIPQTILNEEIAPSVSYESNTGDEYGNRSPWKMTLRTVRNDSSIISLIDEIYKAVIEEVDETHYYYGINNNMTNIDGFINAYESYKSGDNDAFYNCISILENNYILIPLAYVPIVFPAPYELDFTSEEDEYPIDTNLNILNWFETSFGWFNFMENNDISKIIIPTSNTPI